LKEKLDQQIKVEEVDHHINDAAFAAVAAARMHEMVQKR
jgi:uncharacterized protein (UPF0261 family)